MKAELLQLLPCELRLVVEREWQRLECENKVLRDMLSLLRQAKYGPQGEQLSDAQYQLLELEPGVTAAEVAGEAERSSAEKSLSPERPPRKAPHPGRNGFPAHLPRLEEIIACSAEQCQCVQCGEQKKVIGYETSEELDMKPVEYFVRVIKREKRACPACEEMGVSTAPLELKIIEKGKASNRVVVDVLLKKYADHLPLYRQAVILERETGLELSRMTLCGWVMQTGGWLEAISRAMKEDLLTGGYIQADETPVAVQSERTKGRNHQAYLWEYSRPGGPVVFDFQVGRSREGPRKFLGQFSGVLQSDAYKAYAKIGGPGLVHAGCWAHARREFIDVLKLSPGEPSAVEIVAEIAKLYGVEKHARTHGLCAAERQQLRAAQSVAVLSSLREKVLAAREKESPQNPLSKACDYALGNWERLSVYASNGQVEIDNNWCENALRPLAIGRKNWLHIGSEQAGPKVAAIISVIETCRRLRVNARDYLLDVLPKLPTWPAAKVAELTPAAWQARRNRA